MVPFSKHNVSTKKALTFIYTMGSFAFCRENFFLKEKKLQFFCFVLSPVVMCMHVCSLCHNHASLITKRSEFDDDHTQFFTFSRIFLLQVLFFSSFPSFTPGGRCQILANSCGYISLA